jgi:hypothetical protein
VLAVLFLMIILAISWDMARQTTFPGANGNLKERMAPSTKNNENE